MTEERTFVLHDGENEDTTAALHRFLEGIEWEGDEGGVYVYPPREGERDDVEPLWVRVGDTIVRAADGTVTVRKKQS